MYTSRRKFRKPSNCVCPGSGWKPKSAKWVRLDLQTNPLLKCLRCGWKWRSNRRYVNQLPFHVEQSQSGLTDQDILDRILDGSLIVDTITGERVTSVTPNCGRNVLRIRDRESNGSTYQFVTIRRNSKKKDIAVHRLVWMAANKRLVPDGMDVDHVNGKQIQFPNSIHNLRLLSSSVNRYVPTSFGYSDDPPF